MARIREARRSAQTITLKWIAAASGLVLVGFVIVHMLGNLLILGPASWLDRYAWGIKSRPWLLWPGRVFLLGAALAHVWATFSLWSSNRRARAGSYAMHDPMGTTLASRTMMTTGLLVGLFVLFHLYHFTWHGPPFGFYGTFWSYLPELGRAVPDVRAMVVRAFRQPLISVTYLLAMGILFFHVRHGVRSIFHTTGIVRARSIARIELLAKVIALGVCLGFSLVPLAVLLGLVR
ncbi:succinate dehydrogenase cytochrome b subunit [Candidatus Methylacidithermus pantelleriae]|uniref:Succinate dehydrogenase/fumarate reductase, cytochrome b subunit n=1 Tax=Candidatus Methylacidithermus pantelleriae TaxID=2744239 RepID=A0A8J2FPH1_9BACT|nr:succinate dehydrogenase cytochrome b subunit [Candidatus Methylacidithermus pantelleriae]CAF0702595.1 Succinate dehydrogenase/fumarate reductase, cytochrome b subunit [Candidatus Methylacidithermus pantelleriae]